MILLDTNVVSELIKPRPDPGVESWIAAQPSTSLFLCCPGEAELRYGVAILPAGRRREKLMAALEGMLAEAFADRILPFDGPAAASYAEIAAARRLAGRPISQFDAQIAAIAKSRGASLASRNTKDFVGCGIVLIDPWNL
jgi:predicted nucleic acid-binding protein